MSTRVEEPWTVKRLLDWTTQYLHRKGFEAPGTDAQVLLAHVLDCTRIYLFVRHDEQPTEEQRQRFRELVKRRAEGCPVAYLVGRKEFFLLDLEVGPAVLIPRADSHTVVYETLKLLKGVEAPEVLDLGTGSGNLAIAVAKQHATARVTAVDLSPDALAVAQRNAAKHGVSERISFLQGDLFEPLPAEARFHLVLSNPPYIPREDLDALPVGVRDYEPLLALDGGPGGFTVLDRILARAHQFLHPGGHLVVEIGSPQEKEARARFEQTPGFRLAATVHDADQHPRVLLARWDG